MLLAASGSIGSCFFLGTPDSLKPCGCSVARAKSNHSRLRLDARIDLRGASSFGHDGSKVGHAGAFRRMTSMLRWGYDGRSLCRAGGGLGRNLG